jgi:hypothetical protein
MKISSLNTLSTVFGAVLVVSAFSAAGAVAQGPAGAGASAAVAGNSSSHSLNPMKWVGKKESKPASDATVAASDDVDKRLETKLIALQVLAPTATLKDSCASFQQRVDCVAALHASHNVGLNFACVKSNVTGVRVGGDTSSCRMPAGDKPLSLAKTIKLLKPDADSKGAAKDAETIAKEELKEAGA